MFLALDTNSIVGPEWKLKDARQVFVNITERFYLFHGSLCAREQSSESVETLFPALIELIS